MVNVLCHNRHLTLLGRSPHRDATGVAFLSNHSPSAMYFEEHPSVLKNGLIERETRIAFSMASRLVEEAAPS